MKEKILEILKNNMENVNTEINEQDYLIRDLKMNSLDAVNVIADIEEEFGIEIPDGDIKDINTVGELIGYVEKTVC